MPKKKLYCCSGSGGGGGPSPSPRPTPPKALHVPVGGAIAKLFPTARPCEGTRKFICLALRDGRQVRIGPGGTFSVLESANDKSPVAAGRKAISAVMLLKGWSFEEAVTWMNKHFGPALTRNSAAEYFDILLEKRTGR
jgi:hypothetical protein